MATKKKGLAKTVKSRGVRKTAKSNPGGLVEDFKTGILPGFGGYAATRFLSRAAYQVARGRWPNAAPHIAAASSLIGAGATYYGSGRVEALEPYQQALSIGASVAALQTVAQVYLPAYGWIVSDIRPEDYDAPPAQDGFAGMGEYFPGPSGGGQGPTGGDDGGAGAADADADLADLEGDLGSLGDDDGDGLGTGSF